MTMEDAFTEEATPNVETVWFGVGCFHFGYTRQPPYNATIGEYCDHLRNALEKVTAVNNIEIVAPETDETISVLANFDIPCLNEHSFYHPPLHNTFFNVEFDVFIPSRIQEDLVTNSVRDTRTENFRIFLEYTYFGPIAYIQLLDPDLEERPEGSMAVQVVREYFKREVKPNEECPIRFEFHGPSPFHADFSVSILPTEAVTFGFTCNRIAKRAYDEINFESVECLYNSLDEAFESLREEMRDEIGLFYSIIRTKNQESTEWFLITEALDSLTDSKPSWFKHPIKRLRRGKQLGDLFTRLVNFQIQEAFQKANREEDYRSVYENNQPTYLQSDVDEEIKQLPNFPTESVLSLTGFLETRRSKALEWLILLLAAILGGAAGAVFTLYFGLHFLKETNKKESIKTEVSFNEKNDSTASVSASSGALNATVSQANKK